MSRTGWFRTATIAIVASGWIGAAPAAAEPPESPATLEECYLNVAMHKSTADMVYLAREICDAVFKRQPRVLTVLDPKTKEPVRLRRAQTRRDRPGRVAEARTLAYIRSSGPGPDSASTPGFSKKGRG